MQESSEVEEMDWYELELSTSLPLEGDGESEFVIPVAGRIMWHRGNVAPIEVGETQAYLVDFVRAEFTSGYPLFDLLDMDAATAQYLGVVGSGRGLSEELQDRFPFVERLLLIDRVVVLPEHRGRRVGQLAVLRLVDALGSGATLPLIIPYPLQFSGGREGPSRDYVGLEQYSGTREQAFARLASHWGEIGFEKYCDMDEYEIWLLDPDAPRTLG